MPHKIEKYSIKTFILHFKQKVCLKDICMFKVPYVLIKPHNKVLSAIKLLK